MIQKIAFIFALFSLLFSMVCLVSVDTLGLNSHCPLMSGHSVSLCVMNPLEHIQEWQSAFTVTLAQNFSVIFLALAVISFAILCSNLWKNILLSLSSLLVIRRRRIDAQILQIQNHLQDAFSRGVLNPKLF